MATTNGAGVPRREPPVIFKKFVERTTTTEEESQLAIDLPTDQYEHLCRQRAARDKLVWVAETEAMVPHIAKVLRDANNDSKRSLCDGLALLLELQLQANQQARKP